MKVEWTAFLLALLIVTGLSVYVSYLPNDAEQSGLVSFTSKSDLFSYLEKSFGGSREGPMTLAEGAEALALDTFSTTNVQVAGVDESDVVKTDGELIYLVGVEGITIIRALPPSEMEIVSRIRLTDLMENSTESLHLDGLFLLEDRLVAISTNQPVFEFVVLREASSFPGGMTSEAMTYLTVFNIEDPGNPVRVDTYGVSGGIKAARMTSGVVYVVAQEYIWEFNESYSYPKLCSDSLCRDFPLASILHDPESEGAGTYTNILALDPLDGSVGSLSVIAGHASTVYMSLENLYVTFPQFGGYAVPVGLPRLQVMDGPHTTIYRIGTSGTDLWIVGHADVSGTLLNQFSMDEHEGFLRVVTTTGWSEHSNVYVLDEEMKLVGVLEGLAPNESVHSARFVGEALYLVTFKKVDPFFVIDLSNPYSPEVLGFLKIPGFSDYLHPLDETHVLGIGLDTIEAEEGDFAWFQGLKLSLFDVSDVSDPKEVSKFLIGDRGTSSAVLYDHKAFLRIPSDDLIVLPVNLVEDQDDGGAPWEYGGYTWQGAYVVSIVPEEGFELVGRVSHTFDEEKADDTSWHYTHWVYRALYIEDSLYTISESMVKANHIPDLAPLGSLNVTPE